MEKSGLKNPVTIKVISITIMIFLLLIPSSFIMSMVREREMRKSKALREIAGKWGDKQEIAGPIMLIPYRVNYKLENGDIKEKTKYIHLLPEELIIAGDLIPEERYRGIYKFIFYRSNLDIKGSFDLKSLKSASIDNESILWDEIYLNFGINSMIGIEEAIQLKWGNEDYRFEPGLKSSYLVKSGVNRKVKLKREEDIYKFEMNIKIRGSEEISFIPLGKVSKIDIKSTWKNPSFSGAFLPIDRKIDESGFEAKWKVFDLNRNYPQVIAEKEDKVRENHVNLRASKFGVKLIIMVDEYKKNARSIKYMIMFVGLSFIIFFFVEVLNSRRIHPIQYLLVGFGNLLFYLLLLSISEHLSFNIAYLMSSIAVIGLISLYSISVLGSKKFALLMMLSLSALYVLLFVLLQNQDYSLLLGSFGLFLFLGLMMYVSKDINWYEINFDKENR